jgi:hypothetical protein
MGVPGVCGAENVRLLGSGGHHQGLSTVAQSLDHCEKIFSILSGQQDLSQPKITRGESLLIGTQVLAHGIDQGCLAGLGAGDQVADLVPAWVDVVVEDHIGGFLHSFVPSLVPPRIGAKEQVV